jgi:GNAT superfamily N-acetyltransferase
MEIRQAKLEDIETLSRLNVQVQQLHAEAYPKLFKMPEQDDFAVPFFESLFEDVNVRIYIVEDPVPTGYVVLRIVRREENPFTYPWKFAYIDQISVQPEYQGKGVGKLLMARAAQLAEEENLNFIALDSWGFNTEAHGFFESVGYDFYNYRMWKWIFGSP